MQSQIPVAQFTNWDTTIFLHLYCNNGLKMLGSDSHHWQWDRLDITSKAAITK